MTALLRFYIPAQLAENN